MGIVLLVDDFGSVVVGPVFLDITWQLFVIINLKAALLLRFKEGVG